MKFNSQQIADLVNGDIEGDKNAEVNFFSKIEDAQPLSLTFLANPKYESFIYNTKASIALVNSDFAPSKPIPSTLTLIKVNNAYESLAQLLNFYENIDTPKTGIEEPVFIHKTAKIGKSVYIGPFTYIGEDVVIGNNVQISSNCHFDKGCKIGENTKIYSGVKFYDKSQIGRNCVFHSGSVIGSDGFGFAPNKENQYQKIIQIGNVIIEDHVEIGSNTVIDRATMGSTIIHKGVKLDNMIQVAHNVEIGENTVIASHTAIAGSSKVGKNCMIGGQVAIAEHLTIANHVKIAGKTGIAKSVTKDGEILQGPLAFNLKDFQRSYIFFRQLPMLAKRIEKLEKEFIL